MKEHDPLDALLREWKPQGPTEELDQRIISAYRSALPRSVWRRFWRTRVSVPVPVLMTAALAILALLIWLRPSAAPVPLPPDAGVVTRLNAAGFQPLPNGEARILPASEVQR